MGTKNISLPPDLEAYVDGKVASGEYAHASEVIRHGIRLMMHEEADKLEWLRAEIQKGIDDFERGDFLPHDEAFREVERVGRALLKSRRQNA
ncbi:MAG: type II toxin-antitoxin system ParD family antitoxin [Candidatus Eremiobacteraeota bacterium]|nr:type II toxin-antitoxin system ParD family antitoxin [Candidatus Eremiobacteraeota bacterium]MBV8584360.1 type II toxin-antitoxin system ParD family antitoxin [Candidatus Eremiobacteraeota bacterium]